MPLKIRIFVKQKRKRLPPEKLRKQFKSEFQNLLRRAGMKGVNNIRSEIKKRKLIKTGEMFKSVNYKMTKKGVKFVVAHPAPYLEKGIRRHTMRYLMKAKRPIPIEVSEANVIFRWASPKSFAEGHWKHPGFKRGKKFMSSAVKRTREEMSKEFRDIAMKVF